MMNKKKLRRYLQELRYIVPTLYFNFHYLPWRQAIKLPIVLYKPHLLACKGKVRIAYGLVHSLWMTCARQKAGKASVLSTCLSTLSAI